MVWVRPNVRVDLAVCGRRISTRWLDEFHPFALRLSGGHSRYNQKIPARDVFWGLVEWLRLVDRLQCKTCSFLYVCTATLRCTLQSSPDRVLQEQHTKRRSSGGIPAPTHGSALPLAKSGRVSGSHWTPLRWFTPASDPFRMCEHSDQCAHSHFDDTFVVSSLHESLLFKTKCQQDSSSGQAYAICGLFFEQAYTNRCSCMGGLPHE